MKCVRHICYNVTNNQNTNAHTHTHMCTYRTLCHCSNKLILNMLQYVHCCIWQCVSEHTPKQRNQHHLFFIMLFPFSSKHKCCDFTIRIRNICTMQANQTDWQAGKQQMHLISDLSSIEYYINRIFWNCIHIYMWSEIIAIQTQSYAAPHHECRSLHCHQVQMFAQSIQLSILKIDNHMHTHQAFGQSVDADARQFHWNWFSIVAFSHLLIDMRLFQIPFKWPMYSDTLWWISKNVQLHLEAEVLFCFENLRYWSVIGFK